MIHLIYIYLIINVFVAGYFFEYNMKFNDGLYIYLSSIILLFFGAIILVGYVLFVLLEYLFRPISVEISFQYKMYFTDYFDKIYLDDNYTDCYDSREKKLKRTEELAKNSSIQMQRHNRQIQKKYGNK